MLDVISTSGTRIGPTVSELVGVIRLRARARTLHAREETKVKYRRFRLWANGQRLQEDGRGLGVPGGGAAQQKF